MAINSRKLPKKIMDELNRRRLEYTSRGDWEGTTGNSSFDKGVDKTIEGMNRSIEPLWIIPKNRRKNQVQSV